MLRAELELELELELAVFVIILRNRSTVRQSVSMRPLRRKRSVRRAAGSDRIIRTCNFCVSDSEPSFPWGFGFRAWGFRVCLGFSV